jgi:hypothetical protein
LNVVGNVTVNGDISINESNSSLFQPVYGSDDGLVLYLPFNENSSSLPDTNTTYDRSPYGNDGNFTNIDFNQTSGPTKGKYGNAMLFDGDNDVISIREQNNLSDFNEFTLEAWIKTSTNDYMVIVGNSPFGNSPNARGYGMRVDGVSAQLNMRLGNDTDGTEINVIGTTSLNDNEWHHVVGTYDKVNLKVYVDGVQEGSTAFTENILYNGAHVGIGANTVGATLFDGTIDEVKIYKRALSREEIRTHYLRGKGFGASGAITADRFRIVNTTGSNIFEVNNSGLSFLAEASRFVVDNGGNVGIGTTAPTERLTVGTGTDASSIAINQIFAVDDAGAAIGVRDNNDDIEGFLGAYGGGSDVIQFGSYTAHNLSIVTSNNERMVIEALGNVSIVDEDLKIPNDNQNLYFGASDDARIYFNGSNLIIEG